MNLFKRLIPLTHASFRFGLYVSPKSRIVTLLLFNIDAYRRPKAPVGLDLVLIYVSETFYQKIWITSLVGGVRSSLGAQNDRLVEPGTLKRPDPRGVSWSSPVNWTLYHQRARRLSPGGVRTRAL